MVEIIDIPYIKNVYDDNPLIRKVPNYAFLDFKETMYFYYGNKYNKYNWIDQYPIKIEPIDETRDKNPLIHVIRLYIPFMQKYNFNVVIYIEPYLIKDFKTRKVLFPPPIIIIDTKHLREKKVKYN